ncbi:COMPASS complex protein [Desarmillaria tabescens]|uniref:COMPASS complex protein n=1 Tax=Armillaria tabescens TaxID=1929756 RepID=A0AA39KEC8_ARMTA|nr:COMPASS complex protein [Desarmillaria tabescens]KAK0459550.1 COMPASS complex protein [Desarmillaria tabescens]
MDVVPAMTNAVASPPREAPSPQPINHTPSSSKKRKRPPATASPAPEGGAPPVPEVISSRADLSSRPRLSISRGPYFTPLKEGSEFFKTDPTGINRGRFRYTPAGINPPGCYQPCHTIETNPTSYRISWEDRSPFLHVTKDALGLLGTKGFRSARCNAPIREGRWFMENIVLILGERAATFDLAGEGERQPLNGPVGLDGYSYGIRDKTGEKVTLSRPRPYGRPFTSGDVIGMYICLPPRRQADEKDPHDPAHIKRERIAIDLKGQEVFEILEYPQSKEMIALMDYSGKSSNTTSVPSSSTKKSATSKPERPTVTVRKTSPELRPLPVLSDSRIVFFINGECQGVAFQDLYDYLQLRVTDPSRKAKEKKRAREGVKEHRENPFDDGSLGYYPFISLFNSACVRINPGPDFDFPPPPDMDALANGVAVPEGQERTWRPICERYNEYMAEQWALDEKEEEEGRIELLKLAEQEKEDAEKKAQRLRKRQQAEARKRAKQAAVSSTPEPVSAVTQPSPLRHYTAYGLEEFVDRSPAPQEVQSAHSEPTSEYGDIDAENTMTRHSSESPWPQTEMDDIAAGADTIDSLIASSV